jgi:hypothetical protein
MTRITTDSDERSRTPRRKRRKTLTGGNGGNRVLKLQILQMGTDEPKGTCRKLGIGLSQDVAEAAENENGHRRLKRLMNDSGNEAQEAEAPIP